MRLVLRPLAPREINHELIWFSVAVGALTCGALWLRLQLPWPTCLFHRLSGYPCPTCGATRAAIALLRGNVIAAWRWNPLALALYLALGFFNLYALAVLVTGGRRLRLVQVGSVTANSFRALFVFLVLTNWIYLLGANRHL